jgi:hypothetical protein
VARAGRFLWNLAARLEAAPFQNGLQNCIFPQAENHGFPALARQVGVHGKQFFGVQERKLFGQIRVTRVSEFGEHFLRELFGAHEDFPDFPHNGLEKFQIALLGGDGAFPIPLIDVGRVIVIEEVVFADGAHVGADAFAGAAAVELLKGNALPLGCGLNDLRVNRILIPVVGDVELNGRAGRRGRACH